MTHATIAATMRSSHRVLLEAMKLRGRSTVPELAEERRLNIETVREHLKALTDMGLVRRDGSERRDGPGRPEVVYTLTEDAEALFPRREAELLRSFGTFLVQSGQQGVLRAFYEAHLREPREAALKRVEGLAGRARVNEVISILEEMGYMPRLEETDDGPRLRLCHCPVRGLVHASRVPCAMEEQLLEDLLGGPAERERYIPDGDASCTYRMPESIQHERPRRRRP